MNLKLVKSIEKLKNDDAHGAHWLSIKALHILNMALSESNAEEIPGVLQDLIMVSKAISMARPEMVSISNYVSDYTGEITGNSSIYKPGELGKFKQTARDKLAILTACKKLAPLKAARLAANLLINDKYVIASCSYSSSILTLLRIAAKKFHELNILLVYSGSSDIGYAQRSLKELEKLRLPATILHKDQLAQCIRRANLAFIGSDTIFRDGSVINGSPSYLLAKTASKENIKLYAVAEIAKLDRESNNIPARIKPGFDLVPAELIAGIITEKGIINPEKIGSVE